MSGAAVVQPAPGERLERERWLHKPARLARMDRLCALALVAADAALTDANAAPASWDGERVAIVVGTAWGCHATNQEYFAGLRAEGASPRLFAYTLPSSPAGEISIHYGARGVVELLASGPSAGVEAVERAVALCALGRADLAIAVAVETAGPSLESLGVRVADGAAAVVIEREAAARSRDARVRAAILDGNGAPSAIAMGEGAVDAVAAIAAWIVSDKMDDLDLPTGMRLVRRP